MFMLIPVVYGQDNCAEALKKAQRSYNEGIIEKVESLLKPCMENGFDTEQKLQALKLIMLANIYDEKVEQAEENMLKFLEIEPEYEVNPSSDPEEFATLFSTFKTSPLWSFGIIAGTNFLSIRQLEEFGTYNTQDIDFNEFERFNFSFHLGGRGNRYLANNLEVQLEVLYEQDKFKYSVVQNFFKVLQEETQTYITVPLSFTYDFMEVKKFKPFVRVGASMSYLLDANAELTLEYLDDSPNNDEESSTDLKDQRNTITTSVFGGIGVKYKVKRAYFVFDARYRYGLNNVVNEDKRYDSGSDNFDRIFRLQQVDDDFGIDKVSISVGYIRNLYKPRTKNKEIA